jgi:hypothetical protein
MGGNNDTVKLTGYGRDVGETLHTLDLFGVGVYRKHHVPAILSFLNTELAATSAYRETPATAMRFPRRNRATDSGTIVIETSLSMSQPDGVYQNDIASKGALQISERSLLISQ